MLKEIFIGYGIFLILGGVMGAAKAGSKVSLIMGIVTGILMFVAAWVMMSVNPFGGWLLGEAVSLLLVVVFSIRWMKTKKIMPAGMLFLFSFLVFAIGLYDKFFGAGYIPTP